MYIVYAYAYSDIIFTVYMMIMCCAVGLLCGNTENNLTHDGGTEKDHYC